MKWGKLSQLTDSFAVDGDRDGLRADGVADVAAQARAVERPGQLADVLSRLVEDIDVQGSNVTAAEPAHAVGALFGRVEDLAALTVDVEFLFDLAGRKIGIRTRVSQIQSRILLELVLNSSVCRAQSNKRIPT